MTDSTWLVGAVALVLVGSGCTGTCADDETLVDGACVVAEDTDTVDTDSDSGEPVSTEDNLVALEWTIEAVPNDNHVRMTCGDRTLFDEDGFNSRSSFRQEFFLRTGETCQVWMSDDRGGTIPSGSVFTCSVEAGTWEAGRFPESQLVAEFEVVTCADGCADPIAENYNANANLDDGSCEYIDGCTDERALNFNVTATRDDNSCDFGGTGIATVSITTDAYPAETSVSVVCDDYEVFNRANYAQADTLYEDVVIVDAGFDCVVRVIDSLGDAAPGGSVAVCGEEIAVWEPIFGNFTPIDMVVSSFFMTPCSGCTDEAAPNYDEEALVDDGSCESPVP